MIESDRLEMLAGQIEQPRVLLPDEIPAMSEYDETDTLWPRESLERRAALFKPEQ